MDLKELSKPLPIESIDFRIQSINKGGYATILAYKDARVDMNRLDEVCGPENWHRKHIEVHGVVYCGIGIDIELDEDTGSYKTVWKWDAGTESFTEKQKGEASDSFKRAGFNWGIGRELYDYPVIQIKLNNDEFTVENSRAKQTYNLKLKDWKWSADYDEKGIVKLSCVDDKNNLRFEWPKVNNKPTPPAGSNASSITIQNAIEEMKKCDTMGRLQICWTKHKVFQKDPLFINAKEEMKTKLSTNGQN